MTKVECCVIYDGTVCVMIKDNGSQPDVDITLDCADAEVLVRKLIRELVIWETGLR